MLTHTMDAKTEGYEEILTQFLENARQSLLRQIQNGGRITLTEQAVTEPIREFWEGKPVVADVYLGHIFAAHFGVDAAITVK